LLASLVPGLLIMALAVANAIPDFHQDRLVGKRNLVVRLGRRRGVLLYLALAGAGLAVVPAGVVRTGVSRPNACWPLLAVPLLAASAQPGNRHLRAAAPLRRRRPRARRVLRRGRRTARRRHPGERPDVIPAASSSTRWPRRSSFPGSSPAIAISAVFTAAPNPRPASAFPTSSTPVEAMRVVDEIVRNEVPLRDALSVASRWSSRTFFAVAEALGRAGVQLKVETNGQRLDDATVERLARLPIRSIQISLDGDTEETYGRQRPGGSLARAHAACRRVTAAALPLEVTFAPTRINIEELPAVPRAREGARRLPLQHRQADARRHGGPALGLAGAHARAVPALPRDARSPFRH
jgi:hypothetical protein